MLRVERFGCKFLARSSMEREKASLHYRDVTSLFIEILCRKAPAYQFSLEVAVICINTLKPTG